LKIRVIQVFFSFKTQIELFLILNIKEQRIITEFDKKIIPSADEDLLSFTYIQAVTLEEMYFSFTILFFKNKIYLFP